jgi:hypothetical protein
VTPSLSSYSGRSDVRRRTSSNSDNRAGFQGPQPAEPARLRESVLGRLGQEWARTVTIDRGALRRVLSEW